jgi:hypothetical protein
MTRLYACLVGLVLLLPILLGPATMPLLRALGGAEEHHCACGMIAGKCGCAECERLEQRQKLDDELVRGQPLLRSSCDDGTAATAPTLARATLAPAFAVPWATSEACLFVPRSRAVSSRGRPSPPTPPPRDARV